MTSSNRSASVENHLQACADALGRIYATCCQKNRSAKMDDAYVALQLALAASKESNSGKAEIQTCIGHIETFGGHIGVLYATCCTPVREPMYQDIFRHLQRAHLGLWRQQ